MLNDSEIERSYPIVDKFKEASSLLALAEGTYPYYSLEKREQSIAEEISSLYYTNLNSNIPWGTDILQNYPLSGESSKLLNYTPRECLSLIFKYDRRKPSLKEWFSDWMNDLTRLHQEILQNIKGRYSF
jgi:hypothetical protein